MSQAFRNVIIEDKKMTHLSDEGKEDSVSSPKNVVRIIEKGEHQEQSNAKGYLISAIVAAYNSERFMRGLLEDLESQSIADQIEIIIVETGSDTQEINIVREFQERFSNIIYVRTSRRVSAVAATNIGVKMATGEVYSLNAY